VGYQHQGQRYQVQARLVVGADGRFSKIRQLAGVEAVQHGAIMDVLWFRLPARPDEMPAQAGVYADGGGTYGVAVYRRTQWQIGLAFPKGAYRDLRSRGLPAIRQTASALMPWLGDRTEALQAWSQTSLLLVESSRVRRWYRPGLLLIGDAAHVMSPAGAVGINAAIADAVAAARLLATPLKRRELRPAHLAAVQRRRERHIRLAQWFQNTVEEQIWAAGRGAQMSRPARLVAASPRLRALRDRVFVYSGLWPERVGHMADPVRSTVVMRREQHARPYGAREAGMRA
jgi:2-polyprenyl-6-methoxyphenol hydroxylase-like FAD-dependent oxidoreductase